MRKKLLALALSMSMVFGLAGCGGNGGGGGDDPISANLSKKCLKNML